MGTGEETSGCTCRSLMFGPSAEDLKQESTNKEDDASSLTELASVFLIFGNRWCIVLGRTMPRFAEALLFAGVGTTSCSNFEIFYFLGSTGKVPTMPSSSCSRGRRGS